MILIKHTEDNNLIQDPTYVNRDVGIILGDVVEDKNIAFYVREASKMIYDYLTESVNSIVEKYQIKCTIGDDDGRLYFNVVLSIENIKETHYHKFIGIELYDCTIYRIK